MHVHATCFWDIITVLTVLAGVRHLLGHHQHVSRHGTDTLQHGQEPILLLLLLLFLEASELQRHGVSSASHERHASAAQ